MLLVLAALPVALGFAPDRPGVGESTASVPNDEVMIEAGAAVGGQLGSTPLLVLPTTVGRIGLGKDWELRLGTPSVVLALPGPVSATGLNVGGKFSRELGGDWAWSVVPTIRLAPLGSGALATDTAPEVSANVAHSADTWGVWGTGLATATVSGQVGGGGGAGAWYGPDDVGLFAHGGWMGDVFLGGGGWWVFAPDAQVDLTVDVTPGDIPVISVSAGAAVQR